MKKFKRFLGVLCAACMMLSVSAHGFAVESPNAGLVQAGTLDNGVRYVVVRLTEEQLRQEEMSRSYNPGNVHVTVPKADWNGTHGVQIGNSFIAAPDKYVYVKPGNITPSIGYVNISFSYISGETNSKYIEAVGSNEVVIFELNNPEQLGVLKASGTEGAGSVGFTVKTMLECPDEYNYFEKV